MIHPVVMISVCLALASATFAQQAKTDDVVRINTELVQTDVMVFGKDGGFVDNLKRDQFELKVDGRPHEIAFFERISAGSRNEEAQLAAARGMKSGRGAPVPLDRGRTVIFFLDDIHLSASSIYYTRSMLNRFIDHQMGQNDEAAIFSTSGQIGFLQQLTDNKSVLRAAVERLHSVGATVRDFERPPMSEYQALQVDQGDRDVLDYFVDEVLRNNPGISREAAASMVSSRASAMLKQAAAFTVRLLDSLEGRSQAAGQLPGRKLLFLISDGFLIDSRNSDSVERIRRITTFAARSGVVIYSIDARGLATTGPDISESRPFDPSGRLARAAGGELAASQDALNGLARDTGGRLLSNTNDLSKAVDGAIKETSVYYLIAWRPDTEEQRTGRFRRLDVSVTGQPGLSVRIRRNFGEPVTDIKETGRRLKASRTTARPKTPIDELHDSLRASYPREALPTNVAVSFLDLPQQGTVLTVLMKTPMDLDQFSVEEGKLVAKVDVGGLVLNDEGRTVGSFQQRLLISGNTDAGLTSTDDLLYNYRVPVKPGLYQVRVASRDLNSGRNGSAMCWIEVPDLTTHRLALSSIIAGERPTDFPSSSDGNDNRAPGKATNLFDRVLVNTDYRFARTSLLRFLVFTYNATNADAKAGVDGSPPAAVPDVAIQVQVLRDNEPVITTTLRRIETNGAADFGRLPYAAEVPLSSLPAGRYQLRITVIDRIAKTSAFQQMGFQVD